MLATLLDFDINSEASREAWSLHHASDHREIREAIEAANLGDLPDWELSPINWNQLTQWHFRHQTSHNDFNGALGLAGSDISSVDFSKPEDAKDWFFNHFREHLAAHNALGI